MGDDNKEPSRRLKTVVVTYNSAAVLPEFLASLAGALPSTLAHELIIVDNASIDETLPIVRSWAQTTHVVVLDQNLGFAAGVNAGVRAGRPSDTVLVLNPDIRLRPGAVTELLEALKVPGTGIAVPRMLTGDGRLSHSLRREPTILRALGEALFGGNRAGRFSALGEVVRHAGSYDEPQVVDWATGATMAISAQCLDAVGPWDESFFLYSEETDFALRARDLGFTVRYTPSAEVVHLGGESGVSPVLWALLTVNRIRLYRRRHGRGRAILFRTAVTLNEAIRAISGSTTHTAALRALFAWNPDEAADALVPGTGRRLASRGR